MAFSANKKQSTIGFPKRYESVNLVVKLATTTITTLFKN